MKLDEIYNIRLENKNVYTETKEKDIIYFMNKLIKLNNNNKDKICVFFDELTLQMLLV